ncbi:hypothetical protein J1605_008945 [Eschrichtius robustus]|uniref:AAA+ ATPase domain-containing protein n=1 Tax=Eschrichtius robustus TaxID=9764 RepID=A0AB34GTU2_ESCRO|nr:hypothetical protein J1605_008945 [Eschrichtius robustus]
MVGVLAMAAAAAPPPVKDYGNEASKKRRKDNDRTSCKTITKYLSPMGKTGDRVFSPPKSSNILDYFRKTSPTNEKTQTAKKYKIKSSTPLPADSDKDCKTPLDMSSNTENKKRGKRLNLSHQLSHTKTENESPVEINSDDSKEDSSLSNNFVESSTSALLYKKHVEVLAESIQDTKKQSKTMTSKKSSRKVSPKQGASKNDRRKLRKRKHREVIDLSESLPLAEELNLLKRDGNDSKQIMPSLTNEIENTANDAESRDNITKTAQLNDSTITVSYEEFLKSHNESEVEQAPDSTVSICIPSETVDDTVKSDCMTDPETYEISQQVRFKTVTVLAQVHPIPPKKTGKIPSIFLKQKQVEMENSLSDPENEQTIQKRKSNVVIHEEELELAVLEAGSSEAVKPKCTLEERQQFMKAFRQPTSDALKNGVKKSSDKQKELNEKSLNEEGRDNNSKKIMENPNIQMISNNGNSQTHADKGGFPKEKSKKLKKKNKKILDTGAIPGTADDDPLKISSPCNNKSSRKTGIPVKDKVIHSKAETEDSLVYVSTPKPSRRSVRSSSTPATVIIRGTDSEDAQDDSPVKASTPKAANLSGKHSLYTAELITVSSDSESPIRMKFTRISTPKKSKKKSKKRSKKSEAADEDFESQTRKVSSASKNVSKAKRLIEKAKALHISRSKATEGIVTPLRRSSRHQTLPESQDATEKPQACDVQFKAKRDFLMSGLPDLLKRQIAKKAAALDVYNAVSTSFQSVVHIQQKDDEQLVLFSTTEVSCGLSPGIGNREQCSTALVRSFLICTVHESELFARAFCGKRGPPFIAVRGPLTIVASLVAEHRLQMRRLSSCGSRAQLLCGFVGRRKDLTEEVRNLLLEEIRWSNPEFSLRKYFPLLLKKRTEHQVLSECHRKQESPKLEPDVSRKETKRKRVEMENHKSKRKKPNEYSESPKKISGKLEELDKRNNSSGIKLDSSKGLFPKTSRKKRTALSTRCKVETEAVEDSDILIIDGDKSTSEVSSIPDPLDGIDFKGSSDDEEENRLCNTVLITGPTGVGKTAAVYACAQELGFKIFEVNASSQRSGRQILSQLKEATQSHQVDKQGVNSQKPCFFNSYNIGKSPRIKNSFEQKPIIQTKSTNTTNKNVKEFGAEEPNRKNATSLILFEEVDVIFEEDAGFLNAIKTFMATTKRPVILTTSDPTFSLMFDGCFQEINFNTPSLHKIRTKEEWHKLIQLLTEFQMRNVDFLYSNLEFILPLPVNIIPETENFSGSSVSVDTNAATKNMKCLARKPCEGEKPLKKSQKKKCKKKMVILDDSDLFDTELDFSDEFISLSSASSPNSEESKARDKESNPETKKLNKCLESKVESIPRSPKTPAEKKYSVLVSHCLNSLTEFMDNMSFLDALLTDVREHREFGKNDFGWTNGKVKSGLCDEFSLESSDGWTSQSSGELKAAVEALSFTKCSSTISKALETSLNSCKKVGKDPTKELTFYVSQKRNNVHFSQSAANLE